MNDICRKCGLGSGDAAGHVCAGPGVHEVAEFYAQEWKCPFCSAALEAANSEIERLKAEQGYDRQVALQAALEQARAELAAANKNFQAALAQETVSLKSRAEQAEARAKAMTIELEELKKRG